MNEIQSFADDMKNWVQSSGSGVIQANPNWQNPVSLSADTGNGGHMYFSGNGLVFTDSGGETLRSGLDSEGRIYADAIKAGTIEAVNIKSCLVESALTVGTDGGSMNVYIGTKNPHSSLNPLNGGNVIWAMSDQYQSMFSSGQIALTGGNYTTRIHPSAITIGDDDNQVLTQQNFAGHAYKRIKSWVEIWIADWITINKKRRYIWEGKDSGVDLGKLRDLQGQGTQNYSYTPGSDNDYGTDEVGEQNGIDLGDSTTSSPTDGSNLGANFVNTGGDGVSFPINETDSTDGMLTFTEAYALGLGPLSGDYPEDLGTIKGGYRLMIYTPSGKKHWYHQ